MVAVAFRFLKLPKCFTISSVNQFMTSLQGFNIILFLKLKNSLYSVLPFKIKYQHEGFSRVPIFYLKWEKNYIDYFLNLRNNIILKLQIYRPIMNWFTEIMKHFGSFKNLKAIVTMMIFNQGFNFRIHSTLKFNQKFFALKKS